MDIQMTPEFERLVKQSVEDGYYETPHEAMEAALCLLQQKITKTAQKKAKIRTMIEEGMKGPFKPIDTKDIIARAEAELDQEAQANG